MSELDDDLIAGAEAVLAEFKRTTTEYVSISWLSFCQPGMGLRALQAWHFRWNLRVWANRVRNTVERLSA